MFGSEHRHQHSDEANVPRWHVAAICMKMDTIPYFFAGG